jgi:hypothetical protein
VGCHECSDELLGSGTTELVRKLLETLEFVMHIPVF